MATLRLESMSCGVTRLSVPGVGYADVAAQYTTTSPQGLDIIVERTDIAEEQALAEMLAAFRRMEGLPPVLGTQRLDRLGRGARLSRGG